VGEERIRVLRVIARMNMGGPAYHVSLLSGKLDPGRYDTLLVTGRVGPGEESLQELAERYGAQLRVLDSLGPELRPGPDLRALREIAGIVRGFRPHIVHTHTAKAGFVGRLAALAVRPRPIIVHTYHGHVLEGYFGPTKNALFRNLERTAGRVSDRLIGVSRATVDDLVRLKVAPATKFEAIPIGLELDAFARLNPEQGADFRAEIGATPQDVVATCVGRLVPIKRLEGAIAATAIARELGAPLKLVVVGDGECRDQLEALAADRQVSDAVSFVGYRRDLPAIMAGTDIALLSSDNEGTPVSLIEAAAGGRPAVATRVGGVADVVAEDAGILVPPRDPKAMGEALARLAEDASMRRRMGERAAAHVLDRFTARHLLQNIDRLYRELLASRASG
jgi:glycosyltransferase involved in cell wall biosynthesis